MREKVAVIKCSSYNKEAVREALKKIFFLTDIREDEFKKILFKPNMLSDRTPEEGVTTHPLVVEEAAKYFKSHKKVIGDSPAGVKKPISQYWEKCGYKKVSENTGIPLEKFSNSFMLDIPLSRNKNNTVPVTSHLKEFSVVNIAKLKTHGLTTITSAVKNLYGLIPGFHKSVLHSKYVSPFHFSEFLASYYSAVKNFISFNIVDAVISMEGAGPASGELRNTGYIIGGRDAVAVDIVCCRLIGVKPENIPYLSILKKKHGFPEVQITGDALIPAKNFDVPGQLAGKIISSGIFRPYLQLLGRFFRADPLIIRGKCRHCMACMQVCPVKAISSDLKFDRKKCINCLCCFETCPYRAISVKKSFAAKIFT